MLLTNPVENPCRHTALHSLKQAERDVECEEMLHILLLVRESPVRVVRGARRNDGRGSRSCQPQQIGWDKGDESENVSLAARIRCRWRTIQAGAKTSSARHNRHASAAAGWASLDSQQPPCKHEEETVNASDTLSVDDSLGATEQVADVLGLLGAGITSAHSRRVLAQLADLTASVVRSLLRTLVRWV